MINIQVQYFDQLVCLHIRIITHMRIQHTSVHPRIRNHQKPWLRFILFMSVGFSTKVLYNGTQTELEKGEDT